MRTGVERRTRDAALYGVDGDGRVGPFARQPLNHRYDSPQLFVRRDRHGTLRPGGLTSDVDDVRALVHHLARASERRIGRKETTPVAEAVGGDVEDSHYDRFVERDR